MFRTSFNKKPALKAKRFPSAGFNRKRVCRLCEAKIDYVDYKDTKVFERFITDRGKIVSRRNSGLCAKHQRRVSEAVKRARFLALIPYVK